MQSTIVATKWKQKEGLFFKRGNHNKAASQKEYSKNS